MNAPLLPGRIEHWPLARLKPYVRNAKTHDADQVAKIAASMAKFGWTVRVLVAAAVMCMMQKLPETERKRQDSFVRRAENMGA